MLGLKRKKKREAEQQPGRGRAGREMDSDPGEGPWRGGAEAQQGPGVGCPTWVLKATRLMAGLGRGGETE